MLYQDLTKFIRGIFSGLKSYSPAYVLLNSRRRKPHGTFFTRYCYSVWLRHLVLLYENGLSVAHQPNIVAELGPGGSIGVGLAALISGSKKYYGLDVVKYANNERNIQIFNELVELFRKREIIPDQNEFPRMGPLLKSYSFPSDILSEKWLKGSLKPKRIDDLRSFLEASQGKYQTESQIRYACPWYDSEIIESETVDMIYSQAVLEHVEDLKSTYHSMHRWLKKGGYMSHQIDFKSHGISHKWNGHWSHSDFTWKLIKGKKLLINREPLSTHISLIKDNGFKVVFVQPKRDSNGIDRDRLAARFKDLSDYDLSTCGAYILSIKE